MYLDHICTNQQNWETVCALLRDEPYRYDAIATHVHGFGIHTCSQRPVRYLTILRAPADRMISKYYKILRLEHHPRHAMFKALCGPEEAVQHIGGNLQMRTTAGVQPGIPETEADLARLSQRAQPLSQPPADIMKWPDAQ